jgi:hypothetical protein
VSSSVSFSISAIWSCPRPFGHVQYIANRTTALATNSHEIIIPANIFQPRAFLIAGTVSTRSASSIVLGWAVWPVGGSTAAFDVDPTGPVRMVEAKSSILPSPCTAMGALRFRGREGRFFSTPGPADNRRRCYPAMPLVQEEITTSESLRGPIKALNKASVLLRESLSSPFRLARRPSPWVELPQPQLARSPPRAWATAPGWVST